MKDNKEKKDKLPRRFFRRFFKGKRMEISKILIDEWRCDNCGEEVSEKDVIDGKHTCKEKTLKEILNCENLPVKKYQICEECGASESCKEVGWEEYKKIKEEHNLVGFELNKNKEPVGSTCDDTVFGGKENNKPEAMPSEDTIELLSKAYANGSKEKERLMLEEMEQCLEKHNFEASSITLEERLFKLINKYKNGN